jgi:hypothetical protein
MDRRVGPDAMGKRKNLPCQESNPARPFRSLRYTDRAIPALAPNIQSKKRGGF